MKEINRPYIIGETALHHEGELDYLLELIDEAHRIGINAIKFHALFNLNDYFVSTHDGLEIIKKISLQKDQIKKAIEYALQKELDVVLLCNDVEAINFALENQKIRAIEIHATGLNDIFLLEKAAQFPKTVILGVGGSSIDEIKFAIDYLNDRGKSDILLMHGFQNYPTAYGDIFLERIEKLKQLFNLPMGYADHTDPENKYNEWISVLGLTKGAYIIEKHFTTKFGEKRIDAQAAITVSQMQKIKELAQVLYEILGLERPLSYSLAELTYGDTGPMKKAPVARVPIKIGEVIDLNKIAFKRTKTSANIQQKEILNIIGLTANKNIEIDEVIDYSKVNFRFTITDTSQFRNTNK